jgi:hypothetical protein
MILFVVAFLLLCCLGINTEVAASVCVIAYLIYFFGSGD